MISAMLATIATHCGASPARWRASIAGVGGCVRGATSAPPVVAVNSSALASGLDHFSEAIAGLAAELIVSAAGNHRIRLKQAHALRVVIASGDSQVDKITGADVWHLAAGVRAPSAPYPQCSSDVPTAFRVIVRKVGRPFVGYRGKASRRR